MLELDELQMVVLGLPNDLHCQATFDVAAAGKHVVCEKPLCLNLRQADQMIEACRSAGVKLMYAEELCFAPKYVRLKKLLDDGALGKPTLVKQSEKHNGPHAPHFWEVDRSGGGVAMDMGCHAVEFFRWMLGKPGIESVYAQLATQVHWSFTMYEELWNYGFPQEFAHFVDCVQHDKPPIETGEDGRAVLEALFAAYQSAGTGSRVRLPFDGDAAKPWDLWRSP